MAGKTSGNCYFGRQLGDFEVLHTSELFVGSKIFYCIFLECSWSEKLNSDLWPVISSSLEITSCKLCLFWMATNKAAFLNLVSKKAQLELGRLWAAVCQMLAMWLPTSLHRLFPISRSCPYIYHCRHGIIRIGECVSYNKFITLIVTMTTIVLPIGSVVVLVGSWLAGFDARTGDREWTNEIVSSGRLASHCWHFYTWA